MKRTRPSERILQVAVGVGYVIALIMLLGFAVQGIFTILSAHFVVDRVYGVGFAIIGIMFIAILTKSAWPVIMTGGHNFIENWWSQKRNVIIITTLVTLIFFVLRLKIFNFLLYIGFIFGGFILTHSHLGIRHLTGVDIYTLGAEHLAWLAQWYFVYVVLGWIQKKVHSYKARRAVK